MRYRAKADAPALARSAVERAPRKVGLAPAKMEQI